MSICRLESSSRGCMKRALCFQYHAQTYQKTEVVNHRHKSDRRVIKAERSRRSNRADNYLWRSKRAREPRWITTVWATSGSEVQQLHASSVFFFSLKISLTLNCFTYFPKIADSHKILKIAKKEESFFFKKTQQTKENIFSVASQTLPHNNFPPSE